VPPGCNAVLHGSSVAVGLACTGSWQMSGSRQWERTPCSVLGSGRFTCFRLKAHRAGGVPNPSVNHRRQGDAESRVLECVN
jgi:hypothetical protein